MLQCDSKRQPTVHRFNLSEKPQASGPTFNYNNVWLYHDSLSFSLWAEAGEGLWFSRLAAGDSASAARTPAELLVNMKALIRLCFSGVTGASIKALANGKIYTHTHNIHTQVRSHEPFLRPIFS